MRLFRASRVVSGVGQQLKEKKRSEYRWQKADLRLFGDAGDL
jgi:hypothetical protein